jgi:hypothetical protein
MVPFVNRFETLYNGVMSESEETRREQAMAAGEEEIAMYLHDPSPRVIQALLENRRLAEEDVLIIVKRKNLPPDILKMIFKDNRWSESYPVRLALARNPGSPLSVSLTIARYLRIFDLEDITRSHFIPLVFRHKVEMIINERLPTMPLGNKKTLAKKAAGGVLLKLLLDADAEVVKLCLNNPHITEGHLFKVISRPDTRAETIMMIAKHPNWSSRPLIRFSLARNTHTPLSFSVGFLAAMTIMDLRELYADPSVPVTIKPFIHRELWKRGEEPMQAAEEKVFEIDEEEMVEFEADGRIMNIEENQERSDDE